MRIFSVTPIDVPRDELARRQSRYDALAPAGVTVELANVGPGAPRALETPEDVRASESAVVAALRSAPGGYDVLMPDCVLDPGVAELAGELPVVGILRLALGWQVLMGRVSGMVARNEAIAAELAARAAAYGWSEQVAGVEVLGLDLGAVADHDQWDAALSAALGRFDGRACAVINGCSAVAVQPARSGPTVVDPTGVALRLLAAGEGS